MRRVGEFITEIHAVVTRFCSLVMQQHLAGAWLELDRAQKIAENMGARRTVNLVQKLASQLGPASPGKSDPAQQSWNLADASNRIMEGLQALNAELHRVEQIYSNLNQTPLEARSNASNLSAQRTVPPVQARTEEPTIS